MVADFASRMFGLTLTIRDATFSHRLATEVRVYKSKRTGESGDRRPELEEALLKTRSRHWWQLPALGMGYDKPMLGFVVHCRPPASVVAYYQQVGRAGRALNRAYRCSWVR